MIVGLVKSRLSGMTPSLRRGVFPVFSFTLFTVLLDASSTDGMCVFLVKAPKQFSSDQLSSGYVISSVVDASAPGDL